MMNENGMHIIIRQQKPYKHRALLFITSALLFVVYLIHQISPLQILLYNYTVLLTPVMLSPEDFENQTKVSLNHILPIVAKVVEIPGLSNLL